MKIHNFRVGHATNSSSSHSIVLLDNDLIGKVDERLPLYGDDEYGWSNFVLVSPEEKLRYLAAQFFTSLCGLKRDHAFFSQIEEHLSSLSKEAYVDHQSVIRGLDEKKIDVLKNLFLSPRIAVLGGNDNEFFNYEEAYGITGVEIPFLDNSHARFRRDGNYFVFYEKGSGIKARVSLNTDTPEYTKSSMPELVDLKITDYCNAGCNFCYQSSTIRGKHASLSDLTYIISMLGDMDVFEVAIGGGEPTSHPDFFEILKLLVDNGITPNFTTFSSKWTEDKKLVQFIVEHVGGIGVSCHSSKGLKLVHEIRDKLIEVDRWKGLNKAIPQHVVGSVPISVTADLLASVNNDRAIRNVLLLGYKEVGFGKNQKRYDDSSTPAFIKMALDGPLNMSVSMDTALVDQYPDLMKALNVPKALYSSREGAFSCYIDAVEKTMGSSSYVEKSEMVSLPISENGFKEVYAKF